MKTWNQFKSQLPIHEAVLPMNRQYGFVGTAGEKAGELLSKAVAHIKKANEGNEHFKMSDMTIGHFLDSKGGRHLADLMSDKAPHEVIQKSLKNSIGEFAKVYNPSLYESFADVGGDLHENDPHLTKTVAHAMSAAGKAAAAKRRAADKEARAAYLAKKEGGAAKPAAPEHKPEVKKPETSAPTGTGIYHPNPAKRQEAHTALRKIMNKPLKAHEASEKIKKHFDDERLHGDIHHFAKAAPDTDVRPLVKKRMEQLRKQRGF
ncbi:hypothetical protein AAY80_014 [Stenotrophomonas phage vB_SmaS-DLP_6]|nr:hypothetical protein AAY80_014 [Stenotrophomonas phage vB_SmaS-DLP_6]